MKLLLIGNVNGAYRTQNLVKVLLDKGHEVSLVASRFYAGTRVLTTGRPTPFRMLASFRTLLANFLFVGEVFLKAPFADCLYLLPMNHTKFPVAYLARMVWRKRLIAEFYFSLFDTAKDRGWICDDKSFYARLYRFLDRLLLTRSDWVVHLSRRELEHAARLVGATLDEKRVVICPLVVDPRAIAASAKENPGSFRLCWWGSFIPLHGLEKILSAMALLRQSGSPAALDILGVPGKESDRYAQLIKEQNLYDYVRLHTEKTFADGSLEAYLVENCDLAFGVFGDSEKAWNTIPNKIIDAFAMGLPVLTMEAPALEEFIDTRNELFTCANTPEAIAEAIWQRAADRTERSRRAAAGYRRYLATFSPARYAQTVAQLLDQVTEKYAEMPGGLL